MFIPARLASSPKHSVRDHIDGPRLAPDARLPVTPAGSPTSPDDVLSRSAVLVFSSDPLAAALLAAAIELAGNEPLFASAQETARAAVKRVRPRLVLIDCDHEETCCEEFIGPAMMMKAKVVLLRNTGTQRDVTGLAERMHLRVIDLPNDHEQFIAILHALPES